jgi:phenylpropionate dioxygenase-like ring-hydroxylating dioxygenase large terminal subunit
MTRDIAERRHFDEVLLPLENRRSLPPWCYSDPAFLDAEIRRVFRRAWVGIGRVDRLAASGDFAAFDLAGAPVILLRDGDGQLRAFANSCRHRGTLLLKGEGNCRAIRCPFHGWSYGLDGALLGAPQMDSEPGFDKASHGLVPVRLAEMEGFLFVTLDDALEELADWLGDFPDRHAPWSLADMVTGRRREFEVACNWKLFLEVFNEYYHLRYVHPGTIGGIYHDPDDPDATRGHYVTQFGIHDGVSGLLADSHDKALPPMAGLAGRNRDGTRYSWMFPNMTFAVARDAMWIYEAHPLAPDRTRVALTVCFPQAAVALPDFGERAAAYYERVDVAIAEDIAVLELQQAGLTSPLARSGPFCRLEPNVGAFEAWLAERVSA